MRVRSSLPPPMAAAPGTIPSLAPSASASSPSNATGVNPPSITSASETLGEAIAGAREVVESQSKIEEGMATNSAQPVATASSGSQPEKTPSSAPQPNV